MSSSNSVVEVSFPSLQEGEGKEISAKQFGGLQTIAGSPFNFSTKIKHKGIWYKKNIRTRSNIDKFNL